MKTTRQIILFGRVQGVFFRESMCRKARELGVTGWVRNAADGSVQAMVQGTPEAVAAMLAWAQTGPGRARVERAEITDGHGDYASFDRLDSH
jgi:acylphosphatase